MILRLSWKEIEVITIFSIKHDLARLCFQFWPKIGDEGDKIEKKTWRGVSRDSFFSNYTKMTEISARVTEKDRKWQNAFSQAHLDARHLNFFSAVL